MSDTDATPPPEPDQGQDPDPPDVRNIVYAALDLLEDLHADFMRDYAEAVERLSGTLAE